MTRYIRCKACSKVALAGPFNCHAYAAAAVAITAQHSCQLACKATPSKAGSLLTSRLQASTGMPRSVRLAANWAASAGPWSNSWLPNVCTYREKDGRRCGHRQP